MLNKLKHKYVLIFKWYFTKMFMIGEIISINIICFVTTIKLWLLTKHYNDYCNIMHVPNWELERSYSNNVM